MTEPGGVGTPGTEAAWEALLAKFDQECEDALNAGIRPGGGDELKAWNYVVKHFRQVIPLIVSEHRSRIEYAIARHAEKDFTKQSHKALAAAVLRDEP